MTQDQRSTAAHEGWISQQVTILRFEPMPDSPRATYTVRVYISPGDSRVEVTPDPPSVRERSMALLEARRLLQQREQDSAATVADRQALVRAIANLTRDIDALP